jgi:hypothetical protein
MALSVIKAAVVLWLLSPGAPPEQQQQSSKASIEGIVARIGSGEPIPGVEVMLGRVATAAPAATPAVDTATAFETTPLALIPSAVRIAKASLSSKGSTPAPTALLQPAMAM